MAALKGLQAAVLSVVICSFVVLSYDKFARRIAPNSARAASSSSASTSASSKATKATGQQPPSPETRVLLGGSGETLNATSGTPVDGTKEQKFQITMAWCGNDWACTLVEDIATHFPDDFEVEFVKDPPPGISDIVIASAWGRCTNRNPGSKSKLSQSFRRVFVQMEPSTILQSETSQLILSTSRFENPQNIPQDRWRGIYMPYMVLMNYGFFRRTDLLRDPKTYNAGAFLKKKTLFASFAARRCIYGADTSEGDPEPLPEGPRAGELRYLASNAIHKLYKNVSHLSSCRRDTTITKPMPKGYSHWRDEVVHWHSVHKFGFAMENCRQEGYITEKLANVRLANSIPIYLGDPRIEEMINPKAIIHCLPDGSWPNITWTTCINEIARLDNNDSAYMQKLSEPLFQEGEQLPDWMKIETYSERIAQFVRSDLEDSTNLEENSSGYKLL